jgi:hypothetical protein
MRSIAIIACLTLVSVVFAQSATVGRNTADSMTLSGVAKAAAPEMGEAKFQTASAQWLKNPTNANWNAIEARLGSEMPPESETRRRQNFLTLATLRLIERGASDEELKSIVNVAMSKGALQNDERWKAAVDQVEKLVKEKAAMSLVKLQTTKDGATVKYQTIGERDRGAPPTTIGPKTNCTKVLPVGVYYMWTERGGKTTSSRDERFRIVGPEEPVHFDEDQL